MGKLKRCLGYCPYIGLIVMWLVLFACNDDEVGGKQFDPSIPVTVNSIIPDSGGITTPIVIKGSNFGTDKSKVKVLFDDREAVVINVTNELIYALVPRCSGGETVVKVIVNETSEGVLQEQTFNYIVSAKVTSLATDYFTDFDGMMAIAADDDENVAICQWNSVLLYSSEDNKMATILPEGLYYYLGDACFSADKRDLYVMPQDPNDALLIVLHKEENWSRDIIFADDDALNDLMYGCGSVTIDQDGMVYIYGVGASGGRIYRVNPETKDITKLGEIAQESGQSLAYNPQDGYLYLSIYGMNQIVRFPAKEGITPSDVETVIGGNSQIIETGEINGPIYGIDFNQENILYAAIQDTDNWEFAIYQLDLTTKEASHLTGAGDDYVDGTLEQARFAYPMDVSVNTEGFIYVMEYFEPNFSWEEYISRLRCISIQ